MPIRIKSKMRGFRRCGIAHPAEYVEYPDDRFSAKEVAILKAEPMLIVEIVDRGHDGEAHGDLIVSPEGGSVANAVESGTEPAKPGKKGKR